MIFSSQTLKKRRKYLTIFFAKQCSLINRNSDLPSVLSKKTHKLLSTIHFTNDGILKIIKNLDPNKVYGHDMISIRMIKISDASICKPLVHVSKMGNFQLNGKKLWFQHTQKEINKT